MSIQEEMVCFCLEVSKQEILDAIQSGCHTAADITEKTQAGLACGTCIEMIETIILEQKK